MPIRTPLLADGVRLRRVGGYSCCADRLRTDPAANWCRGPSIAVWSLYGDNRASFGVYAELDGVRSPSCQCNLLTKLAAALTELSDGWKTGCERLYSMQASVPNLPGRHLSVRRADRGLPRLLGTHSTCQGRTYEWRRISRHVFDLVDVATILPCLGEAVFTSQEELQVR